MKRRIRKISPHQTAKVFAVLYLIMGLIFAVVAYALKSLVPVVGEQGAQMSTAFILLMPILYAVIGYVSTAVACGVYNMVSGWVGGIEITVEELT